VLSHGRQQHSDHSPADTAANKAFAEAGTAPLRAGERLGTHCGAEVLGGFQVICAALAALGAIAIWSGVTMADVAWVSQHLAAVDRVAIGVGAVGGVLVGLELVAQAWREK
jgi:hypothetical protein